MDYNISHEGDWVILGAIKEKMMMIGVDIVVIDRPKNIDSIDSFVKSFESQVKTLIYEKQREKIIASSLLFFLFSLQKMK